MSPNFPKFQDFESAIPLDVERRHSMWMRLRLGRLVDFADREDAGQALTTTMRLLATSQPNIFTTDVNFHDVSGQVHVLTGEEQHAARIAELTAHLGKLGFDSLMMRYYRGEIGDPYDLDNATLAWVSPGQQLAWSFEKCGVNDVAIDAHLPRPSAK